MSDPLATWRRRTATAVALGAAATLACAVWAFSRPSLPVLGQAARDTDDASSATELVPEPLPNESFLVAIWNPPPPPPPEAPRPREETGPEPPVMLRLQLIGIVKSPDAEPRDGRQYAAALYDPEADLLHVVGVGDRLGASVIESVAEDTVTLRTGSRSTRLSLRDSGAAKGGRR